MPSESDRIKQLEKSIEVERLAARTPNPANQFVAKKRLRQHLEELKNLTSPPPLAT